MSAASAGDAPLAVNDLLVGLVLQTSILVVADSITDRKTLTHSVVTAIYLVGLVERRDWKVAGIGLDSRAGLVVFARSLVGQ